MEEKRSQAPARELLPRHIGIIMDGNGRWAKARGLPREMGHQAGSKVVGEIIRHCKKIGVPYITIYAFSTENWKRPAKEVDALLDLLRHYLSNMEEYQKENARLRVLGHLEPLPRDLRESIRRAEAESAGNTAITVNIALNYGGRGEIIQGVRRLLEEGVSPEEVTEELLSQRLYTAGMPDPDLIIRPSGEYRLSNFLLWQSAYSELLFMNVLWPDFTPEHLNYALHQYARRSRRFGGI
ncbi:MAG: isoprenyl transferase [Angelakisella sp.]|nr:isoprenyl transferase [Angelakisella sp.]